MKRVILLFTVLLMGALQASAAAQANKRAMIMCGEWHGCAEWAEAKRKQDPSFIITDAEVEYYHVDAKEVWVWQFYVQTQERGKIHAYLFGSETHGFKKRRSYFYPEEIKYFPGHPLVNQPSRHVKYPDRLWWKGDRSKASIIKRWPNWISTMGLWDKARNTEEEQRVIWSKDGKPMGWRRTLMIGMGGGIGGGTTMILNARQERLNGPYTYTKNTTRRTFTYRDEESFYFENE